MAFRGYLALDGVELANSSRTLAHLGANIPTSDVGMFAGGGDCSLETLPGRPLLALPPPTSTPIAPGRLLATPLDGSRLYSRGLAVVGDCWSDANMCFGCHDVIGYDDSWEGLSAYLGDTIYRPELAPWYTLRAPESAEFGGMWVLDVKGLDTTPTQRDVQENAGAGGAPGVQRDPSRKVTVEAALIGCTSAGVAYGLQWLSSQLRATNAKTDAVLRYFTAHPGHSAAEPAGLVREVHGVVLTQEVQVTDRINTARRRNQEATMYRVSWEMTVARPYAYTPPINIDVEWDTLTHQPIQWVHAANCKTPASCADMPVFFAEGCELEAIEVVASPPPTCGGCLPVCASDVRVFEIPTFDSPYRDRQTAVSLVITNKAERNLTLQGYYRRCNTREDCDDHRFPVQINNLPPGGAIHLDGITGGYWLWYANRKRRPFGLVGTPSGAPWHSAVIDRRHCWEFVVQTDGAAFFDVSMSLADRET